MSSRPSSELISASIIMIGSLAVLYSCISMREADSTIRIAEIHRDSDRNTAEEETCRTHAETDTQEKIADVRRWSERDVAEEETRRARVQAESEERVAEIHRKSEREKGEEEMRRVRLREDAERMVARERTKQSIVDAVFKHSDTFDSDGAIAVAEKLFQLAGSAEAGDGPKTK